MNMMVPNRKEALAKTFNGDRWDFTSKDIALEDMTDRAFNKLTEYGSGPKFEKFYDNGDGDVSTNEENYYGNYALTSVTDLFYINSKSY